MTKTAALIASLFSFAFIATIRLAAEDGGSNSNLRPSQIAGKKLFAAKECSKCHTLDGETTDGLTPIKAIRSAQWFAGHVKKESSLVLRQSQSHRKQRRIFQDEVEALEDVLFHTKPAERAQIDQMPDQVFQGAYLVYQQPCLNCHTIAGQGKKDVGPDLTHVAKEHSKTWLLKHLENPQQFAPESVMPRFDFLTDEQRANIVEYLLTLK